jgi:mannose-1-phosphate guanylyltransferase/mannose-6-phosphate isomerase
MESARESALQPVILCGGTGRRLWPLSRASSPKQYWPLEPGSDTLLQHTLGLVAGLRPPLLVCNEEHRFIAAEQLRASGVAASSILLEPEGRGTASAVAVAALQATAGGEDPLLLILPSDQVLREPAGLAVALKAGRPAAEAGRLVSFAVQPTTAEPAYGYIETEPALAWALQPQPIVRFVEKPDRATAGQLLATGRFRWNSGILLVRASTLLAELERLEPQRLAACAAALADGHTDLDFLRLERGSFCAVPRRSIDVAVLERTDRGVVVPLPAGWQELGSWGGQWQAAARDQAGNALIGHVISEAARNCYLRSEHRLVVGLGVENLVVVETADAVLVASRACADQVKPLLQRLEAEALPEARAHRRIHRPWGWYDGVSAGERWQVKRIVVHPGASLSLQMHHHRAEHWVVVQGTAVVEVDGESTLVSENQSRFIPQGSRHRLSNPGKLPLELIELQSGSYLGEDDIVRFQDHYGRSEPARPAGAGVASPAGSRG